MKSKESVYMNAFPASHYQCSYSPQPAGKGPEPAVVAFIFAGTIPFEGAAGAAWAGAGDGAVTEVAAVEPAEEVDEDADSTKDVELEPFGRSSGSDRLLWRRRSISVRFCCSCTRSDAVVRVLCVRYAH